MLDDWVMKQTESVYILLNSGEDVDHAVVVYAGVQLIIDCCEEVNLKMGWD